MALALLATAAFEKVPWRLQRRGESLLCTALGQGTGTAISRPTGFSSTR